MSKFETIRLPAFRSEVKELLPGADNPLWTLGRRLLRLENASSPRALDVLHGKDKLELRESATDPGLLTLSRVKNSIPPAKVLELIVSAWWDGDNGLGLLPGWSGAQRHDLWVDDRTTPDLGTARDLAEGACELLLAAAYLNAALPVDALKRLNSAAAAYARILDGMSPIPVPSNSVGKDEKPLVSDPPADVAGCIAALESAWTPGHPAVEMVRAGLESLLPWAFLPYREVTAQLGFPVLLYSNARGGLLKTLTLKQCPGIDGQLYVIPDPSALGCIDLHESFLGAFATAAESAKSEFAGGSCVRWTLDSLKGIPSLTGPSLGGAVAAGLRGLAEKRSFDASVVLISGVLSDGTLQPLTAGIDAKMDAAASKTNRRFLVHPEDLSAVGDTLTNFPGSSVLSVGHVSDAMPHLTGVVDKVQDFLRRLGRLGLSSAMVFRPEKLSDERLADFCVAVRVVSQEDLDRFEAEWSKRQKGDHGEAATARDFTSHLQESLLQGDRNGGGPRIEIMSLERVFKEQQHVILRGEPGEGKTTALWLHVAQRCRQFEGRLQQGTIDVWSELIVPLVLPLGKVPAPTESSDLVTLAKREVLRLCYGDKPPPELLKWLEEKLKRREFELCLDALDELVHFDGRTPAPPGESTRRKWLSEQLIRCRDVQVRMTTRLTAADDGLLHEPHRLRIVCFGPQEVRGYIRGYFAHRPELGAELELSLRKSPRPQELSRIPLLLAILCGHKARFPTKPLPQTRTALLGMSLRMLMEWGDEKWRNIGRDDPRDERNEIKEAILRQVAWKYYDRNPRPMPRRELIELFEAEMKRYEDDRFEEDRPKPRDLLNEYLQDGILVPRGDGEYGFVLRSFHEYCLAGWVALDSPAKDEQSFARLLDGVPYYDKRDYNGNVDIVRPRGGPRGWGREKDWPDDLMPRDEAGWRNVWPLVAGRLGNQVGWLFVMEPIVPWYERNICGPKLPIDHYRSTWKSATKDENAWLLDAVAEVPESHPVRVRYIEWLKESVYHFRVYASRQVVGVNVPLRKLGKLGGADSRRVVLEYLNNPTRQYVSAQRDGVRELGRILNQGERDLVVRILRDLKGNGQVVDECFDACFEALLGQSDDEESQEALTLLLKNLQVSPEIMNQYERFLNGLNLQRTRRIITENASM